MLEPQIPTCSKCGDPRLSVTSVSGLTINGFHYPEARRVRCKKCGYAWLLGKHGGPAPKPRPATTQDRRAGR